MGIPWAVDEVETQFRQEERVLEAKSHAFFTQNGPYTREWKFTREQLEALKNIPNEQLAAAILSPAARPSTPHEQTPSSGHRAGSTPRASQAS